MKSWNTQTEKLAKERLFHHAKAKPKIEAYEIAVSRYVQQVDCITTL